MPLRFPKRRIFRAALYLASAALVAVAADMVLVQARRTVRPGYETTRIVSPTGEDGTVDYVLACDAYFGDGVTPENNAAVPWIRALGPEALAKYQRDGLADKLGMERVPEAGSYFVPYAKFAADNKLPESLDDIDWGRKWRPGDKVSDPAVRWIAANEAPLRLIVEGASRPRFFIPFYAGHRTETMLEILLPYLNPMRQASGALRLRSMVRLEAGDIAGFRADVDAQHRIARLLGQGSTMIDRIVGEHVEMAACQAERSALAGGRVPPADARAMAHALEAMGDMPPLDVAVDKAERYFALDTLQKMALAGPVHTGTLINAISNSWVGPEQAFRFLPIPFEATMRDVNLFDDGALVAMREPTYAHRKAAIELWMAAVQADPDATPTSKPIELHMLDLTGGHWPRKLFAVAWTKAMQKEEQARTERHLTRVAAYLAAYKAENGEYPATLADLKLEFPARDTFADAPPIYHRAAAGFALYSLGPNLKDDAGKSDDVNAGVP